MNANAQICTCPEDGYSPHCPDAFFQGGQMLHEVKGDGRLKKRFEVIKMVDSSTSDAGSGDNQDDVISVDGDVGLIDQFERQLRSGSTMRSDSVVSPTPRLINMEREEKANPRLFSRTTYDERMNQANLVNAEEMLANNRDMLRRYEPLRVGKNALTEMSIGGFKVDLNKAAQKAAEVVPLPPAKLPKIFIDPEMNFSHHFFQGLERLIGRDQILEIVERKRYYTDEELILLPLIEGVIKIGYEKKDTNLTVFTKSVLSSTFELDERNTIDSPHRGLLVAANLWGFQYIEAGMECKEPDLRMWLRVCYNKFENIFFNTFKDSGMPAFALEGVQTRYESVKKFQPIGEKEADNLNLHTTTQRMIEYDDFDDSRSVRTVKSHRKRRTKRNDPSIGALLFGQRR
jgi:hypothetical protein